MSTVVAREHMVRIAEGLLPYAAVLLGLYGWQSAVAAILLYHFGMIPVLLFRTRGVPVNALFLGNAPWLLFPLVAAGLLAGVLIHGLWPLAGLEGVVLGESLTRLGLGPDRLTGFAVYYCLVNPPLEELYWRGDRTDRSRWPSLGDLLFGGYHGLVMALFVSLPWVVLTVVLLTGAGWMWRTATRLTGGLSTAWASHLAADLGIMAALFFLT